MATTSTPTLAQTSDPVVIYDVMVEAGTRLLGGHSAIEQDREKVVALYGVVHDRIAAVDLEDLDGQRQLTEAFKAEYRALPAR